jgi:hypothetical protein
MRYSFEVEKEIEVCNQCPLKTHDEDCKLQCNEDGYPIYYGSFQEQYKNCPLKKEAEEK